MRITPLDSFNYINGGYGVRNITYVDQDVSREEKASEQVQKQEQKDSGSLEVRQNDAPRATDPNSVSLTFNKNDDFSYIGSDSPLQNLDLQKAISNMQRDSILSDYRRFVGTPVVAAPQEGEPFLSTPDGSVFLK